MWEHGEVMAEQGSSSSPVLREHLERASTDPKRYLDEDEVDDITEAFEDSDVNGDGRVTREELAETLASFSLPDEELAALRRGLDQASDAGVSLDEVLVIRARAKLEAGRETIVRSFASVDTDGNGLIDVDELRAFMLASGGGAESVETELQRMLGQLDVNHDGQISLEEFIGYHLRVRFESDDAT